MELKISLSQTTKQENRQVTGFKPVGTRTANALVIFCPYRWGCHLAYFGAVSSWYLRDKQKSAKVSNKVREDFKGKGGEYSQLKLNMQNVFIIFFMSGYFLIYFLF